MPCPKVFDASYKKELVHTRPWQNPTVLVRESADWFTDDNTQRRHSTIGYVTPLEKHPGHTQLEEIAQMRNVA